jgi:hypothetical protein
MVIGSPTLHVNAQTGAFFGNAHALPADWIPNSLADAEKERNSLHRHGFPVLLQFSPPPLTLIASSAMLHISRCPGAVRPF